jgi:hypothetical protein
MLCFATGHPGVMPHPRHIMHNILYEQREAQKVTKIASFFGVQTPYIQLNSLSVFLSPSPFRGGYFCRGKHVSPTDVPTCWHFSVVLPKPVCELLCGPIQDKQHLVNETHWYHTDLNRNVFVGVENREVKESKSRKWSVWLGDIGIILTCSWKDH